LSPTGDVRDATPEELAAWDAATVDAPGGHVYQSRAWAEHRAASGWRPRFLLTGDGGRVLALERRWAVLPGGSAYLPRGPVPLAGVDGGTIAARQIAVADALAGEGKDVVAADPEVPASDAAFGEAIRAAGFVAIEEIQPSRHRIALALDGADEMLAFGHIAKSTRQRIRAAEASGLSVVRYDRSVTDGGPGEGFARPAEPAPVAFDRFYDLLLATGERRHFTFGPREGFTDWWDKALESGHLVYLEIHDPAATDAGTEAIAGLVLYRHGGRLSTVHSADRAETRREHPGALHLARWRAIQLAIREGCTEMDLGGADVAGARRPPVEGEPMWGLYQHKLAFGGAWIELTGAHERVYRRRRYALGRAASRAARTLRR